MVWCIGITFLILITDGSVFKHVHNQNRNLPKKHMQVNRIVYVFIKSPIFWIHYSI